MRLARHGQPALHRLEQIELRVQIRLLRAGHHHGVGGVGEDVRDILDFSHLLVQLGHDVLDFLHS